jgi:hypothetical protein
MQNKLRNSTITENIYPLLEYTLMDYANELRSEYPALKISNALVFEAAISELARRGFIELVDARKGIPAHVSQYHAQRVKRIKRQPVWIPTGKWPDWSDDILNIVRPYMRGNAVAWKYNPGAPRTVMPSWDELIREAKGEKGYLINFPPTFSRLPTIDSKIIGRSARHSCRSGGELKSPGANVHFVAARATRDSDFSANADAYIALWHPIPSLREASIYPVFETLCRRHGRFPGGDSRRRQASPIPILVNSRWELSASC